MQNFQDGDTFRMWHLYQITRQLHALPMSLKKGENLYRFHIMNNFIALTKTRKFQSRATFGDCIKDNQLVIFYMKNISPGCVVRRWKNECAARVFLTPYDAFEGDIFHIKNNQLITLFIVYLINIIIFNFSIYKCLMEKKLVPILRQEVKVKVDIVTSDDIKMYYIGKFQDFTARYLIKRFIERL